MNEKTDAPRRLRLGGKRCGEECSRTSKEPTPVHCY